MVWPASAGRLNGLRVVLLEGGGVITLRGFIPNSRVELAASGESSRLGLKFDAGVRTRSLLRLRSFCDFLTVPSLLGKQSKWGKKELRPVLSEGWRVWQAPKFAQALS